MTHKLPVLSGEPSALDPSLLATADVLLLLSDLLAAPEAGINLDAPSQTELAALFNGAGLEHADNAAALLAEAMEHAAMLDRELLATEYNYLFGPDMTCPIHETAYVRRDKGAVLADLSGFYRAFDFGVREGASERVDHLRIELEFVSMLQIAFTRARSAGTQDGQLVTAGALVAFVEGHLGEWLQPFIETLAAKAQLPLYRAIAEVLQLTWDKMSAELGLPVLNEGAVPVVHAEQGTPYECDMEDRSQSHETL